MFVGHYSVAFAAKSDKNKIPLWVLSLPRTDQKLEMLSLDIVEGFPQ
jgi:hypothetical protein